MTRPFGMKGHKKRKRKEDRYDKEEQQQEHQETAQNAEEEDATMAEEDDAKKVEEKATADLDEVPGIPIVPPHQDSKSNVIFVLEKASLEVGKVGKSYQLLNSDEHANFLKRNGKNPADYRPDIAHQALLAILDSPLNKAGRLRAVYVKTEKGVLFEVKPHVRMPRTFKRFCGIMLQLLQKLSITASGKREKLLRVIKNPVTQYFPINSRKIGLSYSSEKLVNMQDYVKAVGDDVNLVFVVGAMAHGKVDKEYTEDYIAVSGYPLSAACCISRICNALEDKWNIL
ncbi:Ribosomal biogenesis, methyltransferase, EMG1/NEP1 [Dillenia turbinata]|uniref:Ribosomal biogenesis, methyltransferase, EMG1/NEP1 n=1 Tax=Dillenia turbinata TaxID=194707 RepID=A0AAN8ZPR4_9MAGN